MGTHGQRLTPASRVGLATLALALGGLAVLLLAAARGAGLAATLAPDAFPPFGLLHGTVVLASVIAWTLLVAAARRARGRTAERVLRRGLALFVWGFNAAWQLRLLLPDRFAWGHSLPLHLCDLAWMAAGWSLWSGGDPQRLRHQVPVLWGLALSALGYLTPAVTAGPRGIQFWTFWITHWQILAVALLNLLVVGTRPTWRGLRRTLLVTLVACALATAVNLALDTSYFFTGRSTPSNPTPLDLLGAWPLRILWIVLLGGLALVLAALPFLLASRPARLAACTRRRP